MKQFYILVFCVNILCFNHIIAQRTQRDYSTRLDKSFDPLYAPFYHGVASGDALHDRVIIWTRVTDFSFNQDSIPVQWFVCTDTLCQNVVQSGLTYALEAHDFCVKVDVTGLQPDTWYYYYFRAFNTNSVIGRTKTLPVGNVQNVRLGFFHGTNYNSGYYNALRELALRNDIDAMIHLGDYIYEYGTGVYGNHPDRWVVPDWDIVTLSDYRARYSHYRLDPDLRLAHQQYPWYIIWDDHEVANNAWRHGAENHDSVTQGSYEVRRAYAIQAFFEWLPLRPVNDPNNPDNHIRKYFDFGDMARLIQIDSRHEARMAQNSLPDNDPNKTMLGEAQYQWLTQTLYQSYYTNQHKWRVIANQVMFVPFKLAGITLNRDQWDGYANDRQRVINFVWGFGLKNNVIITGDIHTSWAADVPNPSQGNYGPNGQGCAYLVEFVSPSISSPSFPFGSGIGVPVIQASNPHIKWGDIVYRGFSILDLTASKAQSDWYFVSTNQTPNNYTTYWANGWYVNNNENFLRQAYTPTVRLTPNPPLAPLYPMQTVDNQKPNKIETSLVLLSLFPNPTEGQITIQFYIEKPLPLLITITDASGQVVHKENIFPQKFDIQYHGIDLRHLPAGTYNLTLYDANKKVATKNFVIIK